MNVLLCLSHSIEEYDQLRLLAGLGCNVASIGGYIDPAHPHADLRPPLDIPMVPEIKAAVDGLGTSDNLGAAQSRLPEAVLDWADVIVYHHYLERLFGQWERVRRWLREGSHRRVIWRSVGQSVEYNERQAQPFRVDGLERVAYSPKEANIPGYSGHGALIRFYKDSADFAPWIGDEPIIVNFTQHLAQRDPYTNYGYWRAATQGLPAKAYGPGSEENGGGALAYPEMLSVLQHSRAYLYTGTQPASYTLGLIEAFMAGIPVVSIGPGWMRIFPYGPQLFEGHELATRAYNNPADARQALEALLDLDTARAYSEGSQKDTARLFSREPIAAQWAAFLGIPLPEDAALLVAA